MRKFLSLLLVFALVVPMALTFAPVMAQEDVVLARLEAYNTSLPKGYGNVSVDDLTIEMVENPDLVIVDVRQPDEYATNHLPNAINIPLRDLVKNLDALPDLDARMVIYCGSGFRSSLAMTALQILGYTDVRNMKGGIKAWEAEEYALTTDVFEAERSAAPELDETLWGAVDAALSGLPEGWAIVKPEDLNVELIDTPPDALIDVRTPDEWASGYIAGAVHMPLESFMSFAGQWPQDKAANIVIYCASGHRGNMAAMMLRTLGYTNVRNMAGGIGAWTTAGLPLEMPEVTAVELDLPAVLDAYITSLPENYNTVRAPDLAVELAENPELLLVDVRTVDEYVEGHLAGAINVPLVELTSHLDMLPDVQQKMVIYCGSGHRSAMAMVVLNLLGYTNARNLVGGVKAWTTAELPLVTDETPYEAGVAPEFDPALFEVLDAYIKAIPAGFYVISADDLNVAIAENNTPYLIDVRTAEETAQGIIQGSVKIELRSFVASMADWPADTAAPVVIYCASDHRAVIAMVAMQVMGYTDVKTMGGGLQAWLAKGYPVVTE
jgi:rhodanese-related sulfurtransferase